MSANVALADELDNGPFHPLRIVTIVSAMPPYVWSLAAYPTPSKITRFRSSVNACNFCM